MLIRLETIYKSKQVILVDEIGKYIGTLENIEQFLECVDLDKEPLEEDDYVFYFVEDNCIFNFLGAK
jgi:GTP-binding protein EngB required for normal cell division